MKNIILIALFIAFGLSFFSCQKTNDLTKIEDSFTLKRNGAEMPIYTYGNAQNKVFVLTLHGGPGGNALSFRNKWNTKLEEKYAMVYWDQRGSGMSQGSLSADNLNLEEMKKDVLALVAILKHKFGDDITLFLLGHSWGSTLGGHVLADNNNQNLFNGYISAASVPDFCVINKDLIPTYTELANEQIAANNNIDHWNEILDLIADTDTTTDCTDFRLHNHDKANDSRGFLAEQGLFIHANANSTNLFIINNFITTKVSRNKTNVFLSNEIPLEDYDLTNQLSNITIPSMVLHGKLDLKVGIQSGQTYFDLLGSTEKTFHQFDKSGHSMFHSEPEKFANVLLNFIGTYK